MRRLCVTPDNGFTWSINCDNCEEPKNSLTAAETGLELIKSVNDEEPFELIITDIHMPIMDGLDMIEQLRKENINIPVVIISALTEDIYVKKAKKLKVEYYLNKPFDFQKLLEVVDELQIINKKGK